MALALAFVLNRTNFGFMVRSFGSNKEATRLGGCRHPARRARRLPHHRLRRHDRRLRAGRLLQHRGLVDVRPATTSGPWPRSSSAAPASSGARAACCAPCSGVIFVSVLTNVLVLSNLGFGWQQIAIGSLIVLAVSVDALARRVSKR